MCLFLVLSLLCDVCLSDFRVQSVFWLSTCRRLWEVRSPHTVRLFLVGAMRWSISDSWPIQIYCHRTLQRYFTVCLCVFIGFFLFFSHFLHAKTFPVSICPSRDSGLRSRCLSCLPHLLSFSKDYSEIWGKGLWKSMLCSVAMRFAVGDL